MRKMYLLKDVVDINIGKTPSRNEPKYWGKGENWIAIKDLNYLQNSKYIEDTKESITSFAIEKTKIKKVLKGTVVFSFKLSIGKVAITNKDIYTNEAIAALSIKDTSMLSSEFLFYALKQIDFDKHVDYAVKGKTLNKRKLGLLKISLPDLQTQNKIVTLLDKANTLILQRKKSITLLEELLKGQFLEMFGDVWDNGKGWETNSISKIVENIIGGWSAKGENRNLKEGEIGVLKVSAVTIGTFRPEEHKVVDQDEIKRKLVHPMKGDLLFSRANTSNLVGATCIVPSNFENLFLPDKLWKIVPKREIVTSEYLEAVLSNKGFRNNISRLSTGSSGSMQNISKGKLKGIIVPIPPIALQEKYSVFYWEIQQKKQTLGNSLELLQDFFQSLLQRAFKGELKFNIEEELNSLLAGISPLEEENDLSGFRHSNSNLEELLRRLEEQDFENDQQYQQAKWAIFQLLEEGKVEQVQQEGMTSLRIKEA